MKFFNIVILLLLGTFFSKANSILNDTLKKNESTLLSNIVSANVLPSKEEVVAISEFTKYGFKNLFTQFHYTPSIPYSRQINPNAEFFMKDYLRLHEKQLIKMKEYAVPYFNLIDQIFVQYGIPTELKYLAVIESSLQTGATSWVGAAGPWQFMPETASKYGLIVHKGNDQRRDYYKSTHAAARFLLNLYKELDDWLLVIAAYNGGLRRVSNAIKKSKSKDFWQLQYHLPLESRNHVKKFIATHYVMEAAPNATIITEKNIDKKTQALTPSEQLNTSTCIISGKYIGDVIARQLLMDHATFEKYNPRFDKKLQTENSIELLLPKDKMTLFLSKKYEILNECVQIAIGNNQ